MSAPGIYVGSISGPRTPKRTRERKANETTERRHRWQGRQRNEHDDTRRDGTRTTRGRGAHGGGRGRGEEEQGSLRPQEGVLSSPAPGGRGKQRGSREGEGTGRCRRALAQGGRHVPHNRIQCHLTQRIYEIIKHQKQRTRELECNCKLPQRTVG